MPVEYNNGPFCSQVRTQGVGCVQLRGHLFASESPEGKKGSEGEGCGGGDGGDGGDEVDDGNDGDDGGEGGDVGPEGEPSTAARVATEIRAAVKGRRAE